VTQSKDKKKAAGSGSRAKAAGAARSSAKGGASSVKSKPARPVAGAKSAKPVAKASAKAAPRGSAMAGKSGAVAKPVAGKPGSGGKPGATARTGLRFGSRESTISPLALTPPPPPPPKKSPSRGKGITIIEPKRQAMKAALEAEKAAKGGKKSSAKLDLANAKSVAAVAASIKADSHGYVVVNGRRVRVISTKAAGGKRKKVKAPPPVATTPQMPSEQVIQKTKTKLAKSDLDHYRGILLQHRRELVGRVTGLEDEALRSNGGNLSNMPLHPADIGTDTFDQDFALGMAATDRLLLQEIDDAIDRIVQRTYGVCQMTGKPIPKARLDAKPWAKYTVEAARLVESGQVR